METKNCRICDTEFAKRYTFKEMMFGMRDEFAYGECPNCGNIQILEVPANIEKYYPTYYTSFTQEVPVLKRKSFFQRMISSIRIKRKYRKSKNHILEYVKPIGLMPNAKILDIGCGQGALICHLFNIGFENISGTDKFIAEEIDHGHGVKIAKKDLSELPSNTYDLLIMHHVLEHMDGQVDELKQCYRLLKKGGVLLVCIPVLNTAWDIYQNNWVQLDAPRHFVLHTVKSINMLADKTGFKIKQTLFDSSEFQFLGSELYQKGIPLTDPVTHQWVSFADHFSKEEMARLHDEAMQLNADHKGDAARFYLHKV